MMGPDDIPPVEAWKLLRHRGITILTDLFSQIATDGEAQRLADQHHCAHLEGQR